MTVIVKFLFDPITGFKVKYSKLASMKWTGKNLKHLYLLRRAVKACSGFEASYEQKSLHLLKAF